MVYNRRWVVSEKCHHMATPPARALFIRVPTAKQDPLADRRWPEGLREAQVKPIVRCKARAVARQLSGSNKLFS